VLPNAEGLKHSCSQQLMAVLQVDDKCRDRQLAHPSTLECAAMIALDTLMAMHLCPLPSAYISVQSARFPTDFKASVAAAHSTTAVTAML
jgi:hypothetical protein